MRELKLMLATLGVATMMAGGATGTVCAPGGTCPAPAPERARAATSMPCRSRGTGRHTAPHLP